MMANEIAAAVYAAQKPMSEGSVLQGAKSSHCIATGAKHGASQICNICVGHLELGLLLQQMSS